MEQPRRFENVAIQILLGINAIVMIYPLVIMIISAFKTNAELFASSFTLPATFNFNNFLTIWSQTNFPVYFMNSVMVTVGSITVILTFGTLAAYALARYMFKLNAFFYFFFLAGLMVPLKLAVIPLFISLTKMGLIDSLWGLGAVYVAMGLPSTVFIMTGFLKSLPSELEESGRMDGAQEWRIMWEIMLPLARPALAIAGIYNAVPIWNDFFFPLVFITSDGSKTLPQGLTVFMGEYNSDWGVLFAGLTLSALPIIVLYILLSRQFIAGPDPGLGEIGQSAMSFGPQAGFGRKHVHSENQRPQQEIRCRAGAQGCESEHQIRRVRRLRRPVGLRQDHSFALHRRA